MTRHTAKKNIDTHRDELYMRKAIAHARRGITAGQSPFGACIVRGNTVLACAHNCVWSGCDSTAHAEIVAIRKACRAQAIIDLSECTIYSTTEPCPMCFGAIHWARICRIVYGATIADAQKAGFNELCVTNRALIKMAGLRMRLTSGVLRSEAVHLFYQWKQCRGRPY